MIIIEWSEGGLALKKFLSLLAVCFFCVIATGSAIINELIDRNLFHNQIALASIEKKEKLFRWGITDKNLILLEKRRERIHKHATYPVAPLTSLRHFDCVSTRNAVGKGIPVQEAEGSIRLYCYRRTAAR